jgi:hypothetical protein
MGSMKKGTLREGGPLVLAVTGMKDCGNNTIGKITGLH